MARILITSLAFCLLLLSVGKSYASIDTPVSNGGHDVMHMHACGIAMAGDADSAGADLFSHFQCHLNMTSLITVYVAIGLTAMPPPNYQYHFSSKVHIQALSTKPPQLT
jgi:hypothetical protein|tara:strand:- start:211 stop:537 length:327 start_codon:yes stop_codon:yes gene_type:complete